MADAGGNHSYADLLLDSTLASVDQAEAAVLNAAKEAGLDDDAQHEVGISVRESMVNAVAHGNRYSSKKKVHLVIRQESGAFVVEIEDEGRGFEPVEVPDPREGENVLRQSGRGLLMIRAFMDEFSIRKRDAGGTAVRMVKYLRSGPETGT